MKIRILIVINLFLVFLVNFLFAQEESGATPLPGMRGTPANTPDISVIGDIRSRFSQRQSDPDRNKIFVKEIEIAMQGYLYPEVRSDVFFAFDREIDGTVNTELEEAYVTFLKLYGGINGKAGKMLVDFGKLNKLHPELWLFVERPPVLSGFFGDHGLNASGADIAYLLPLPFFLQASAGLWNAEPPAAGEFGLSGEFRSARLWSSFPINDTSELEIGASGAGGTVPDFPVSRDDVSLAGADITYKLWPATYARFIFQGEFLQLTRQIAAGEIKRNGFYGYAGYKFDRYWDAGARYDWAENALPLKEQKSGVSLIITDRLTEVTRARLQVSYNIESMNYEGFLQFIFGIGPHSHALR